MPRARKSTQPDDAGTGASAASKTSTTETAPKAAKRSSSKATSSKATSSKASSSKASSSKASSSKATSSKATSSKASSSKASSSKGSTAPSGGGSRSSRRRPFTKKFLEAQRKALLAEREQYLHQAENLEEEAQALVADLEFSDASSEEDAGEGDTISVERERDLVLSAQARAAIREIDEALARIDAGTYGICRSCGEPIPPERLEFLPAASLCVQCKSRPQLRR